MTSKWRNAGAPFTLSDGTEIGTGDVFEASLMSRDVRIRRRKLRPVAPSENVTATRPEVRFEGIDFGSDAAYELARDSGLSGVDFQWREGSGQDGAFLKSDVEEILADG